MCVCVYVCMCVCVYVYVYVCMCVCVYVSKLYRVKGQESRVSMDIQIDKITLYAAYLSLSDSWPIS